MKVTIGALIIPQNGDMAPMRKAWVEADAMGVERIYTSDHFFVPTRDDLEASHRKAGDIKDDNAIRIEAPQDADAKIFEGMSIQAAMAVTTKHAEIGCLVIANPYRNPNLLADMARTIDHLSGGRYVLGVGAGWHRRDFDEYGYDFGTVGTRLRNLERDLETIKARWVKLKPPPIRKIPILFGGGGEKVSLRIVAQHVDEWHYFGTPEQLKHKASVLDDWCAKVGRNPAEITRCIAVGHGLDEGAPLEEFVAVGFTHFIAAFTGPEWDLRPLERLLAWRDSLA